MFLNYTADASILLQEAVDVASKLQKCKGGDVRST